jgi:FkbM family methyltransferase
MYFRALGKIRPQWTSVFSDQIYAKRLIKTTTVTHITSNNDQITLIFHTPNAVCTWRAESFSTKEPETLEWIDHYGGDGAFFDVGANVGLYSLYYAQLYSDQVYAFEPSVFNLGILAKNIHVNSMSNQVNIVPIPLSSKDQLAALRLGAPDEGGAMSTFGATHGHNGRTLDTHMIYRMPGLKLDTMLASKMIPEMPSLMKIDVDGSNDQNLWIVLGVVA